MKRHARLATLLLALAVLRSGTALARDPHPTPAPSPAPISDSGAERAPADFAAMLPVVSERLTPGRVASRRLSSPGLAPLFLVGDDALSLAWLRQRANALRGLKAVGLAVQVQDAAALARIRAAAPDLNIVPVSGDDLALRLRIEHYPVLITATTLEQ